MVPLTLLAATADSSAELGLPQLDPTTFSSQLIWLAITFGALYFALSRVILPRIAHAIEERNERMRSDIDQAEQLKGETDKAIAEYETALANARADASRIARETRDRLAGETERERTEVEAQVAAKLEEAEQRISSVKMEALTQVGEIAKDTAGDIVSKLVGGNVSPDEVDTAIRTIRNPG